MEGSSDSGDEENALARVRILYWKEIPGQVQAIDEDGPVSKPLDPRFQISIDAVAMFDGSAGSEDYVSAWDWRDAGEIPGPALAAAVLVADHLNAALPEDLVARIRDAHRNGTRNPQPGAIDDWFGGVMPIG
jgi:hypothetical protein